LTNGNLGMDQGSKTIYELECELANYNRENSALNLSEIFGENFIEFGASGKVYDRGEVIRELETGRTKRDVKISGFKVEPITESVWHITYTASCRCDDGSEVITLRSSLWKNNGGVWQILFHQGTKKSK